MEIWNERMKLLREGTDITLKEMAELIGVSEATVQRYESGIVVNVPYNAIVIYAKKFNVSPCYIMGWDHSSVDSMGQNEDNESYPRIILTNDEEDMISKFRALDARGKNNVLDTLEREYSYTDEAQRGTA